MVPRYIFCAFSILAFVNFFPPVSTLALVKTPVDFVP